MSMGFYRQECWSGLPFPSPVIKYEVSEVTSLSRVRLFMTPWTVAYQRPLSMGFSSQEYWSWSPFPSPKAHLKVKVKMKSLSRVRLFTTSWTGAYGASPSMGFSRQEYWSGLPFPSPGDLPDPGIEPRSPSLWAHTLTSEPPWKPQLTINIRQNK